MRAIIADESLTFFSSRSVALVALHIHSSLGSHLDKKSICHRNKAHPSSKTNTNLIESQSELINHCVVVAATMTPGFFTQLVKLNVVHHLIKLVRSLSPLPDINTEEQHAPSLH